jgi:nitrogen fixation NifU-like protein
MYPARLLDHFQHPRHVGELTPPAITVDVTNPACGDMLRLSVRFEGDRAVEARYKTRGCTASIAAGSALVEWLTGKTAAEIAALETGVIDEAVGGLAAESRHAAVLCIDAVRALLSARRTRPVSEQIPRHIE